MNLAPTFLIFLAFNLLGFTSNVLRADTEGDSQKSDTKPDFTLSGEPHAVDSVSTFIATLYRENDLHDENLSLKRRGLDPLSDIPTTWPNHVTPKELEINPSQEYRVTIIADRRMFPLPIARKFGARWPVLSRIETLDGKVIFDGAICPVHKKRASRAEIPIVEALSDETPDDVRRKAFPYGMTFYATQKETWAPDTRETILEYVCDECRKARQAYQEDKSANKSPLPTGKSSTDSTPVAPP